MPWIFVSHDGEILSDSMQEPSPGYLLELEGRGVTVHEVAQRPSQGRHTHWNREAGGYVTVPPLPPTRPEQAKADYANALTDAQRLDAIAKALGLVD